MTLHLTDDLFLRSDTWARRQARCAEILGAAWRAQIAAETPARAPQRSNRGA